MRKLIRILSLISLIFNIIIFGIFTQFSPFLWISSIPGISQLGAFVYESSPEKAQGFITWIAIKIKTLLLWIWSGIIEFIKAIIKVVLGEIDNLPTPEPSIDPGKGKYGDTNNDGYMSKLKDSNYDWRFWILGGFIIIGVGAVIYIYWDSVSGCWKRGDDDLNVDSTQIHEPRLGGQLPSPDSTTSSTGGSTFSNYFRESIVDKAKSLVEKTKNLFRSNTPPLVENIPSGIYLQKGKSMWRGLPLPRVETLDSGTEFYITSDKNGLIRVLSNNIEKSDSVDILDPVTGRLVTTEYIGILDRLDLINSARSHSIFRAPENSIFKNPILGPTNVTTDIPRPTVDSTSASTSNLPTFDSSPTSSDGGITPKAKNIELDDIGEWS